MSKRLTTQLLTSTDPRFDEDWKRQRNTAADILTRLKTQEGVILADQVGMGKTYVALAVAATQILSSEERDQVVIFVPAAVADKWVREWRKFSESLLQAGTGIRCVDRPIRSGEEFFKRLGESPAVRKHILVVTHSALTTALKDNFIQLALLYYATRHLEDGKNLRHRIAKWSTGMKGLIQHVHFTPRTVSELLEVSPSTWRQVWKKSTGQDLGEDPVPDALKHAVGSVKLTDLRSVISSLPSNYSPNIQQRLEAARNALAEATQATWKWLLRSTSLDLPLLIVDEAHRLKNPNTKIGRLFGDRVDSERTGAFSNVFRKMLFLTATPFELGHSELVEVLTRMGAVRPDAGSNAPPLRDRLEELSKVLHDARISALKLDTAWGRLNANDLVAFDNWGPDARAAEGLSTAAREAWEHARVAVQARHLMHAAIRPWIIRHERSKRRTYLPGASIRTEGSVAQGGLEIPEDIALPFLLAARAQSVALDETKGRPLFAYGIASSFEAYRRLGSNEVEALLDSDLPDEDKESVPNDAAVHSIDGIRWYRQEIDTALSSIQCVNTHPKVLATVEKAAQLWLQGEKCLIFCWYIKTGEAVERALAARIENLTYQEAARCLSTTSLEESKVVLTRISERLLRSDSPSHERIRSYLAVSLSDAADGHQDLLDLVVDVAIRHLRTPGYLVRYTQLNAELTDEQLWAGINGENPRGLDFVAKLRLFAERLAAARKQIHDHNPSEQHDSEFTRVRAALLGSPSDEDHAAHRGASLQLVRRANGGMDRDIRERLIALFNTPLCPELLVASSVMGEGIDLHQECRHVIHHDLDWNPSVLEQRTGRLDRIGALAERVSKNIDVYEPYLAGTHDEKMFRVVKDRAQWFDVVMGRATGKDEVDTDREENRIPLHKTIRTSLSMNLESPTVS